MTPIIPNRTMSQAFDSQSPYNRIDCFDPNVQKKKKVRKKEKERGRIKEKNLAFVLNAGRFKR